MGYCSLNWNVWSLLVIRVWGVCVISSGIVMVFGLPLFYAYRYLHVDANDFDSTAILTEGAMPAVCLFMVVWIFIYSTFHF